jgi:hypothetical protein
MTVKLSVSLPDDIGAWLARQPNTSAAVAAAVRAHMGAEHARGEHRRRTAEAYRQWLVDNRLDRLDDLDAATANGSLSGGGW